MRRSPILLFVVAGLAITYWNYVQYALLAVFAFFLPAARSEYFLCLVTHISKNRAQGCR